MLFITSKIGNGAQMPRSSFLPGGLTAYALRQTSTSISIAARWDFASQSKSARQRLQKVSNFWPYCHRVFLILIKLPSQAAGSEEKVDPLRQNGTAHLDANINDPDGSACGSKACFKDGAFCCLLGCGDLSLRLIKETYDDYFKNQETGHTMVDMPTGKDDTLRLQWVTAIQTPVPAMAVAFWRSRVVHNKAPDVKGFRFGSYSIMPPKNPRDALGLNWRCVGTERPSFGEELHSAALKSALTSNKYTSFTKEEWLRFRISGLHKRHFIQKGKKFFQPVVPGQDRENIWHCMQTGQMPDNYPSGPEKGSPEESTISGRGGPAKRDFNMINK